MTQDESTWFDHAVSLFGALVGLLGVAVTLVGVIVAAAGLYFARQSILAQTRNSRIQKVADTLMECARRYDEIMQQRDALESDCERQPHADRKAESYFGRFWGLFYEESLFFRYGLLPRDVFRSWCIARMNDFVGDTAKGSHRKVCGIAFEDGWNTHKERIQTSHGDFVEMVEALRAAAKRPENERVADIDRLLDRQAEAGRLDQENLSNQVAR